MADKNSVNLAAARAAGRKEFANETRMLIENRQSQEVPDNEILLEVLSKITDENNL